MSGPALLLKEASKHAKGQRKSRARALLCCVRSSFDNRIRSNCGIGKILRHGRKRAIARRFILSRVVCFALLDRVASTLQNIAQRGMFDIVKGRLGKHILGICRLLVQSKRLCLALKGHQRTKVRFIQVAAPRRTLHHLARRQSEVVAPGHGVCWLALIEF